MTKKQIMIDIDISECEFKLERDGKIKCECTHATGFNVICDCESWKNCYYKQLKRKEQKCEELKEKYLELKEQNGNNIVQLNTVNEQLDQLKEECEEWKNKYYASTTETKADIIKQLDQLKGEVHHKTEFIQEQRDIIDQLKSELKEFKDMAKQGLDNYKDVGGCWGCGISFSFDELLKSYKALELSSQKQLNQLKVELKAEKNKLFLPTCYKQLYKEAKEMNNDIAKKCFDLEKENKKLKSIIKQAIEDFNLEIGTPQYEILLNKSKELGVIKE